MQDYIFPTSFWHLLLINLLKIPVSLFVLSVINYSVFLEGDSIPCMRVVLYRVSECLLDEVNP